MSLLNKKCPNCGHKLKMVDSYPTYHCDNCGKECIVNWKKVRNMFCLIDVLLLR